MDLIRPKKPIEALMLNTSYSQIFLWYSYRECQDNVIAEMIELSSVGIQVVSCSHVSRLLYRCSPSMPPNRTPLYELAHGQLDQLCVGESSVVESLNTRKQRILCGYLQTTDRWYITHQSSFEDAEAVKQSPLLRYLAETGIGSDPGKRGPELSQGSLSPSCNKKHLHPAL